ncbi:uncharacterized protein LOC128983601 [Macrosteles quadrilineatus]|uniref:uncharacterized protein LOC128983601 n=1 Tax=Macrosteles quadrilineatus TaxID=74068 RepID=UPI0023E197A2|nr:uncharacterized protein LOC128983601 [Macrosteles quadrilineatus]
MTKEEVSEDVLYKTHTAIEKLSDGSCVKRVTITRNGKSEVKEEKVDCESALNDARGTDGKDEVVFKQNNDDFDKKMKEKLSEMNKSFSTQKEPTLSTREETYTDGTNKTVKVTRESSSIEETKKTEKIPDGTKRSLKITRESFLEETKKSVSPESVLPEDLKERVNILDESFKEQANEGSEGASSEKVEPDGAVQGNTNVTEPSKGEKSGALREIEESDGDLPESDEGATNENMELAESEDSFLTKFVKTAFKILFYPLYALNIL